MATQSKQQYPSQAQAAGLGLVSVDFGFNVSFPHIFSVLHHTKLYRDKLILTFNTLESESVDGREIHAI
jgi:hypothetical protein